MNKSALTPLKEKGITRAEMIQLRHQKLKGTLKDYSIVSQSELERIKNEAKQDTFEHKWSSKQQYMIEQQHLRDRANVIMRRRKEN